MLKGKSLTWLRAVTWVLLIMTAVIIFWFSHESKTATLETSAFLTDPFVKIAEKGKDLSGYEAWSLQKTVIHTVRKFAHFLEFAQFGFLLCLLLVRYRFRRAWLFAVLGSALYASSDEIHQLIMKTREARVVDVLVDTCGAFCGSALLLLLIYLLRKRRKNRMAKRAASGTQRAQEGNGTPGGQEI